MRHACSMVAFVEGGLPFGSLVIHHQFLNLFVQIIQRFVGGLVRVFSLVHRRATWLMPAGLVESGECGLPE